MTGSNLFSESLLCIEAGDELTDSFRVHAFIVAASRGFQAESAVSTLPGASGISAAPGGSRLVVVSVGTTTAAAGLTMIDARLDPGPDGSTATYPLDPDDKFTILNSKVEVRQRYHPQKVAVLYGR